jgi:DNA-cytosine methyltransferase
MEWQYVLHGAKMIRNYRMSSQPRKDRKIARLWLEKPVLRTANLTPGTGLIVTITNTTIMHDNETIQWPLVHIRAAIAVEIPTHTVSQRRGDPILDICNAEIDQALGIGKIDIVVKENGELFIYKELSFSMLIDSPLRARNSRKYRIISLFAGAGGMTAGFVNQGCQSVFAVDIDDPDKTPYMYGGKGKEPAYRAWTIETLQRNFPDTLVYWGDIRSVHHAYIPEADIVCISPPCVEYSSLGGRMEGLVEHFSFHIVRIVLASKARVIFMENVDAYFESETYQNIKNMLLPVFPYWYQETIDSYDFGTLDTRNRGYAVAWREKNDYRFPKPVEIPSTQRKKVMDYLQETENRKWQPFEGTTFEMFLGKHKEKYSNTGFTVNKNRTLVRYEDQKIACITKGYNKIQSSQSYILHPNGDRWSLFTPEELKSILHYPEWFMFPNGIPATRYYEILGNSVNVKVVEEIARTIIRTLEKMDQQKNNLESYYPIQQLKNGQLSLVL